MFLPVVEEVMEMTKKMGNFCCADERCADGLCNGWVGGWVGRPAEKGRSDQGRVKGWIGSRKG